MPKMVRNCRRKAVANERAQWAPWAQTAVHRQDARNTRASDGAERHNRKLEMGQSRFLAFEYGFGDGTGDPSILRLA
jgi:hypothetical protein